MHCIANRLSRINHQNGLIPDHMVNGGKDVDALCALNFPSLMGASLMKATRWMVHSVVAVFVV